MGDNGPRRVAWSRDDMPPSSIDGARRLRDRAGCLGTGLLALAALWAMWEFCARGGA